MEHRSHVELVFEKESGHHAIFDHNMNQSQVRTFFTGVPGAQKLILVASIDYKDSKKQKNWLNFLLPFNRALNLWGARIISFIISE